MKAAATAGLATLFFLFVSWECWNLYRTEHQRAERLLNDIKISRDSCQFFKSKNNENAVKIQAQEYTISEIRATLPRLIQQAKNLYIPPRLIQGYTAATQQSQTEIKTIVRDSIVRDTVHVKAFNYRDKWNHVSGTIEKDTARLVIESQDSITIFNVQGRRRHPLAWILSKRLPDQVIIKNANPGNKIILQQYLKIK